MIDTIRDHQGVERQQLASSRRFLEECEKEKASDLLTLIVTEHIEAQEGFLTGSQKVLEQMERNFQRDKLDEEEKKELETPAE